MRKDKKRRVVDKLCMTSLMKTFQLASTESIEHELDLFNAYSIHCFCYIIQMNYSLDQNILTISTVQPN